MKRIIVLVTALMLLVVGSCLAEGNNLLLDDFEMVVSGGLEGTVDFGSGNGSAVRVTESTDIKFSGDQALKVVYDAAPGGYIYVARGWGLDAKNANWFHVRPHRREGAWHRSARHLLDPILLVARDQRQVDAIDPRPRR